MTDNIVCIGITTETLPKNIKYTAVWRSVAYHRKTFIIDDNHPIISSNKNSLASKFSYFTFHGGLYACGTKQNPTLGLDFTDTTFTVQEELNIMKEILHHIENNHKPKKVIETLVNILSEEHEYRRSSKGVIHYFD